MKLITATILTSALMLSANAVAQERDAADRDARYEFAFEYDRAELGDRSSRRAMNRRLDSSADQYCAEELSSYRDACRREVVREVRDEMRDTEREERDARRNRYARVDD